MKILNKLWYLCFIISFFSACSEKKEIEIKKTEKALIYGTTDDLKVIKNLNVFDFSMTNAVKNNLKNETQNNKIKLLFDSIKKPQILEILSFGDSLFYNTRLLVSPGDSVSLTIKNKQVVFKGANAAHYNFFYELDSTSNEWAKNKYKNNLHSYKKSCDSIYQRRKLFFEKYITENKVSEEFKTLVGAEIKFEYLYNLISPRMEPGTSDFNVNVSGGFINAIIDDYDIEKDGFFDVNSYLNDISISEFNRPELINNDYFNRTAYDFIKYYFIKSEHLPYTLEEFKLHKKYIREHTEGALQLNLLLKVVWDYYENGFGIGELDRQALLSTIEEYLNKNLTVKTEENLKKIKHNLTFYGLKINKEALEEVVINLEGDTLKVNQLLANSKNKIIVINFWATWCGPCIETIESEKDFKISLAQDKNVEWIHISVEKDFEKWKNNSAKLNGLIPFKQHYKLVDPMQASTLLKALKVKIKKTVTIPKYIILDSDGSIVTNNATSPNNNDAFQEIIDNIYKQKD